MLLMTQYLSVINPHGVPLLFLIILPKPNASASICRREDNERAISAQQRSLIFRSSSKFLYIFRTISF